MRCPWRSFLGRVGAEGGNSKPYLLGALEFPHATNGKLEAMFGSVAENLKAGVC